MQVASSKLHCMLRSCKTCSDALTPLSLRHWRCVVLAARHACQGQAVEALACGSLPEGDFVSASTA